MQVKALWLGALLAVAPSAMRGGSTAAATTPTPVPPSRPAPQALLLNGQPFPQVKAFPVKLPRPVRTLYVAGVAEDGDGSEKRPWNDLQKALCALSPGDRLRIQPGIYKGAFAVDGDCRDGTRRAPIQVLFDGQARLVPDSDRAVLSVRKAHWMLVGVFVSLGNSPATGVSIEGRGAYHVTIDRARVSGGAGPGLRIGEGVAAIRVANARIAKTRLAQASPSAFGIEIAAGARDVVIANSHLRDNPGGSIRIQGPADGAKPASDVRIVGNSIHGDEASAIEAVAAERIHVVGNTISQTPGVPKTRGIVLGRVRFGFVQSNHVSDCEVAVQVGSAPPDGEPFAADAEDVLVDHNDFENALAAGTGIRVEAGNRIRILNNVVDGTAEGIQVLGSVPRTRAVSVANNLVLGVSRVAFSIQDRKATDLFDYNVFSPAPGSGAASVRLGDRESALAEVLKRGDMPRTRLVPGVQLLNRDLARVRGAVVVDRGKSVGELPHRGAAPDIGVEER